MKRLTLISLSAIFCAFIVSGCTNRGMYEAIQMSNKHQCAKLISSQYDDCMDAASKPYDEYERERQESLNR